MVVTVRKVLLSVDVNRDPENLNDIIDNSLYLLVMDVFSNVRKGKVLQNGEKKIIFRDDEGSIANVSIQIKVLGREDSKEPGSLVSSVKVRMANIVSNGTAKGMDWKERSSTVADVVIAKLEVRIFVGIIKVYTNNIIVAASVLGIVVGFEVVN